MFISKKIILQTRFFYLSHTNIVLNHSNDRLTFFPIDIL